MSKVILIPLWFDEWRPADQRVYISDVREAELQGPARRRRGSCVPGKEREVPRVDCHAWNMNAEPIPAIEDRWEVMG